MNKFHKLIIINGKPKVNHAIPRIKFINFNQTTSKREFCAKIWRRLISRKILVFLLTENVHADHSLAMSESYKNQNIEL